MDIIASRTRRALQSCHTTAKNRQQNLDSGLVRDIYWIKVNIATKAEKRKSRRHSAFAENPGLLRRGRGWAAEHGLGAAHRRAFLGCAGIARDSDRLSADHFPSVADKTRFVRNG